MLRCFRQSLKWIQLKPNKCANIQEARRLSTKTAFKEKLSRGAAGSGEFNVGNVYSGFMCTDIRYIKEFNMTAIMLKHENSRTEYLHLKRDDPNNVFSINFRTTPFNSTGLPHILEHTVLCGSKKFPVRDPFFKMLNRSLATFMNAMTGPDYTFYPFSSQNEVDYRNLQAIYLDAVFKPNLNRLDFLQEGWRLEHSNLNDPKSDLLFKGVVFNEMKGAFSENSSVFGQKFLNTILPDHTYGYISGGDPLDIPNLTVEDLRDFHKKYYHPSNARIYSYGNFPLEKNLDVCNQLYLGNYEGIDSSYSRVPQQPRWTKPNDLKITCRFDKMGAPFEKQNQIAIGYLMCDITDFYETFVLHFLSELMVMGPNSPFYKSLIEPNISGGYSSMTGFDQQMKDTMFIIGLQDLEVNKFDKVKQIVDETLDKIIREGFDKTHIDSVMHGIELSIKHQHTRFGLNALFNIVALWNHDGPLMDALEVGSIFKRFKDNLKNPKYLTERVEHYFKTNNHRLTLTMVPDEKYEENITEMENKLLSKKIANLKEEDKKMVYEEGLKLSETQKGPQNIDILPCLALKDIPEKLTPVQLKWVASNIVPVQICEANTNDVAYFKGILNISDLPDDLKMLIPLFNTTVNKMGTKKHSFRDFDQYVKLKTGGLGFATHITEKIGEPGIFQEGIVISSHSLDENVDAMFSIWSELFEKPTFKDVDRFKMLLENYISNMTNGIADSGHMYAIHSANALVKSSSSLKEKLGGLKHIEYMKNLVKNHSPEEIMNKVSQIAETVLDRSRLRVAVNLTAPKSDGVMSKLSKFCNHLPQKTPKKSVNEVVYNRGTAFDKTTKCVHHVMNIPINFCAKAIVTVPFAHPDFAKLQVLARFLSSKYLHPVVREQNGAYGGGARISNDGIFNFYSYRDPNSRVTLDVFDKSAEWFEQCPESVFDDQSIFEAKLGVLQQLDAPVAEFAKGIDDFLHGMNSERLQQHRKDVLAVTKKDMIAVCKKYLSDEAAKDLIIGKCVIGPGEAEGSDNPLVQAGECWEVIQPMSEDVQ